MKAVGKPTRFLPAHFLFGMLVLVMTSCQLLARQANVSGSRNPETPPATAQSLESWYSIYFTDPASPSSRSLRGGPDQHLANAIDNARISVDIAVLQLNLWSVRDALLKAHRRGVRVRMVVESDYLDGQEIQQLIQAGVPVLGDRREGLMHNKFAVIDRLEVWTGSPNFTVNELYRNDNNLIRIRSPQLAQNYTAEFEEMFVDDRFGPGSPANTPNPTLSIGSASLKSCFSPDDGCTELLLQLIRSARQSIYFLAFSFTSDELADALIERAQHGVLVAGVMEASQVASNTGTKYSNFRLAGLDVRLDGNSNQMHHKAFLIDGQIVSTGSFNFTYSAETRNDENLLIIDEPQIAKLYLREFERIFNQAVK